MFRVVAVLALGAALAACNDQRDAEWRAECEKIFNSHIALLDQWRDSARTDREADLFILDNYIQPDDLRNAEELLKGDWPKQFQIIANHMVTERDQLCGE